MNIFKDIFNDFNYKNISGLTHELKCIYMDNFLNKNENSILLVCNSLYEANKFYQSLKNYSENVLFFPMDDFLTSEVLAVSPEFKVTRLETLDKLKSNEKYIVVTNLMGYLRYLPDKDLFYSKYINLKIGDEIDINKLKNHLYNVGYELNTIVNKSGEIAVRGFVIDIFPINYKDPIRIEFFGDEIESIRVFDIDSQLTKEKISSVEIIPNSEFIIKGDLPDNFNHRDIINYGKVESLKDYVSNCIIFYNDYEELYISYENLKRDMFEYSISSSIDSNTGFMHDIDRIYDEKSINLCNNDTINKSNSITYLSYKFDEKINNMEILNNVLNNYLKKKKTVVICVSNRYQVNKITDVITNSVFTNENQIIENKINIIVKNITEGFIYGKYVYISENEIFNKNRTQEYKTNFKY